MPPNPPSPRLNEATSRSKPYQSGSPRKSSRSHGPRGQSMSMLASSSGESAPPLLPFGESIVDLMRETVKKNFPLFFPRNTMDVLVMSAPPPDIGNMGPATDHDTICAYIDTYHQMSSEWMDNYSTGGAPVEDRLNVDALLGRRPATDLLGIKPRPGQAVSIRAMPSTPEYSIRLWAANASTLQFGMDFVESATGEPVNLSHRFHIYGPMLGVAGMTTLIRPFAEPFVMLDMMPGNNPPPPPPGEEIYYLHAEQEVVVQDTFQADSDVNANAAPAGGGPHSESDEPVTRLVRFKVPKHPHTIANSPRSVVYDELHFSFDD